MPPAYTREQAIAAFWAKVDVRGPEECWPRNANIKPNGYAEVWWDGRKTLAHRLAFFLSNAYLPEDKCVLHSCDNRRCCNPLHLFAGTRTENAADRDSKARQEYGVKHHNCRLTEEQVKQIRTLAASGVPRRHLAEKYGVSREHVRDIVNGKKWKHVKEVS